VPPFTDGRSLRLAARQGNFSAQTSGQAPDFVQANLVVVPESAAYEFLLFCQRNPKPCPLLEVVEAGSVEAVRLAPGSDLRRDLPRYRVFRDGKLSEEPTDVTALWRDDLVSFLIGCSFSFDRRLIDGGLEVRNVALGKNVPMYRTSIACRKAGRFDGPLVVSMRPFTPGEALRAARISGELPQVHGAPIHIGNPAALGIADLGRPDYGEAVPVHEGELPVFWACGVTPQEVLLRARLPLAITHAPGHMFVSDLREKHLREFSERLA